MRKLVLVLLTGLFTVTAHAQQADLIIRNARIYTADPTRPNAEALAVTGDRIAFVGSNRGAMALSGTNTEVIDAGGLTIIPGMIDAHAHLPSLGDFLRNIDLFGTESYRDVVALVVERSNEVAAGEWITGRGWDQNDWAVQEFPTHDDLSRAVPDNPVYLRRVDGHAALVNRQAMDLAGIDRNTPDPEGGLILKGPDGEPTGVLIDNAMLLVSGIIPAPSREEWVRRTEMAVQYANSFGLTGMHDAGVGRDTIEVFEQMARDGNFNLRNYIMVSRVEDNLDHYLSRGPQEGLYDNRIWIRAIKISSDGALGSRGAAMLEAYSDDPDQTGLILVDSSRIHAIARRALESDFQLNVHAIGDRANRMVLDIFESALNENPVADHRFRIEHAQILSPQDIPRFAELDVIPSMQGSHQTSDMYWAVDRIGPTRALGAYAWRSLLNSGVVIPNGSDAPVESINPLISFRAFFTRQDAEGWPSGGWYPEQATDRQEALYSVTLWPAYAAFMEDLVGSLTAGKLADFVLLDRDIMTIDESQVLDTEVVATYLGGEKVYGD